MIILELVNNHWLSLIISIVITLIFLLFQLKYHQRSKYLLDELSSLFADKYEDYDVTPNKEIVCEKSSEKLKKLLEDINGYVNKNPGTIDSAIIRHKVNRYAQSAYDTASAKVSFPTYIGLMGTFCGVFVGLIGFLCAGQDSADGIPNLILGVIISMLTSFAGLLMTTRANKQAADCKTKLDEQKNDFYLVIENKLWVALGSSMNDALENLRQTVSQFEEAFSRSTDNFEIKFGESVKNFATTFDKCTQHFGGEFQNNSKILTEAVNEMGRSIEKINGNVENQRDLLKEFRSKEMWNSLEAFIHAADKLESSTHSIEELATLRNLLDESTEKLITSQEEFIQTLVVPKILVEKTTNLLNRITDFEESIKNLGESIKMTDLSQRSELNELKKVLDNFLERKRIADEFTEKSTEELEKYFEHHTKSIAELNQKYSEALENHAEKFEKLMSDIASAIQSKKREFLETLEDAFDVAELNTQFTHLNDLPEILTHLSELKSTLIDKTTLLESMKDIKDEVSECNTSITNVTKKHATAMNENTMKLMNQSEEVRKEVIAQNDRLQSVLQAENQTIVNSLTNRIAEVGVSINSLQKNILDFDSQLCEQTLSKIKELLNDIKFERIDIGSAEQINNLLNKQKEKLSDFVEELNRQKGALDLHEKVGEVQKELDMLINKMKKHYTDKSKKKPTILSPENDSPEK